MRVGFKARTQKLEFGGGLFNRANTVFSAGDVIICLFVPGAPRLQIWLEPVREPCITGLQ